MDGKVLIIDSSEFERTKMKGLLSSLGDFHIIEITDNGYPLINIGLENILLVILEISSPYEKERLEMLSDIRKSLGSSPPVIVTTRSDTLDLRDAALKQGANDYIVKPYQPKRFEKSVQCLVKVTQQFNYETDTIQPVTFTFEEFIARELKAAERSRLPLSILLITLAKTKYENFGEDLELQAKFQKAFTFAAENISTLLRFTDQLVCNPNRDILAILPFTGRSGAKIVNEKIARHLNEIFIKQDMRFEDYFYLQCVTFPDDGKDFQSMMEGAFRKISGNEIREKTSSIPLNTRKYADKRYNQFRRWF